MKTVVVAKILHEALCVSRIFNTTHCLHQIIKVEKKLLILKKNTKNNDLIKVISLFSVVELGNTVSFLRTDHFDVTHYLHHII